MSPIAWALGALCAATSVAACGGQSPPFVADPEPDGPDCELAPDGRLFPLESGSEWTHVRTNLETDAQDEKTQSVGTFAEVGGSKPGVMAFTLTTLKETGSTVRHYEDTGSAVIEHRKQDLAGATHHDEYFIESKIRLDESPERLALDATYSESYTEESTNLTTNVLSARRRAADWRVYRVGEEIIAPAGTFCTVRVGRTVTTDGSIGDEKLYWYAPGVGKVKERDGNKREELVRYTVPSAAP